MNLEAISIPPANGTPQYLLVGLHGWGSNAQDLAPISSMLNLPNYQLIFPNGPYNHPHAPGGKAWYALETESYEGLNESRIGLHQWLRSLESTTGVPLEKTVLAGFSQGGAMTLDVGLTLPIPKLCCLSGYLHSQPQKLSDLSPSVLIVHGTQDPVVPVTAALQTKNQLTAIGVDVIYQEFAMGHTIIPSVLELIQKFLQQ